MSKLVPKSGALLAPQVDYILVDGSGSMMPKWWEFLDATDAFIAELKRSQLNSHLIVNVFDDTTLEFRQRDCALSAHVPFSQDPLEGYFGGTPLYDAINCMGRHLRELDPQRASILVVTDGDESDSKHTDATQARAILDWMRAKGWSITFIGCDFDNSHQAKILGLSDASCIGVQKKLLTDAAKNLAQKRTRHYHTGQDIHFTDDEKTRFGGYLSGPSNV